MLSQNTKETLAEIPKHSKKRSSEVDESYTKAKSDHLDPLETQKTPNFRILLSSDRFSHQSQNLEFDVESRENDQFDVSTKINSLRRIEFSSRNKFFAFSSQKAKVVKSQHFIRKSQKEQNLHSNRTRKPQFVKIGSKNPSHEEVPEMSPIKLPLQKRLNSARIPLSVGKAQRKRLIASDIGCTTDIGTEASISLEKRPKKQPKKLFINLEESNITQLFRTKKVRPKSARLGNQSKTRKNKKEGNLMSLDAPMDQKIDYIMDHAYKNNLEEITFDELRTLFSHKGSRFSEFTEIRRIQTELEIVFEFMQEIDLSAL